MSKTFFNIAEQKTNIINFIKKHKNILETEHDMNITDEFIGKLVKSNNKEFFRLASEVKLKLSCNFYIFCDNFDGQHRMIQLWLPTIFSHVASDKANTANKAIKQFCSSNHFEDVIATRCGWFNMTPKRWETFEAIFDFYNKPKTSSKKTAKKTAKKVVKPAEMKLGDSALLKDDIVFINFEAKEFDHLMSQGGSNIAVYIDHACECNAKNQIDHLINAFKLAKNEADSFIELLETAKKNGAKHVVDSSYIDPTVFNFTK
jgi:hypothetical protein